MSAILAHGQPLTDRRIYLSLWLLQACAVIANTSVGGSLASLVFWLAAFAGTLFLGLRYAEQPDEGRRKLGEYVAAAGLAVFLLALIGRNLMQALVILGLAMQAAKNTTLGNRRDAYFSLVLSFVIVYFAASQSKSGLFLAIGTAYTMACMYVLLLLHAESIRQRSAGVADDRRLPAGALMLTLAVLAAGGLFYLLLPQPPAMLLGRNLDNAGTDYRNDAWEREAEGGQEAGKEESRVQAEGDGGLGSEFGGSSADPAEEDNAEAGEPMDIQTAPGKGKGESLNSIVLYVQAPRPLYLQGRIFDRFDGTSWHTSRGHTVKHRLGGGRYRFGGGEGGETVRQIVTVAQPLPPVIPAASVVKELNFPGSVFAVDAYGTLTLPRRLAAKTQYEVLSRLRDVDGHPATEEVDDVGEAYLQLPNEIDPRIATLAAKIAEGSKGGFAAATAMESYLRENYQYSFETVPQENHIPLADFLFTTKRGHCEYFATAMTIMLRTQGIPARLATGYSATNYNPLTGYYEVRHIDSHAWTEAYLPPHGWVSFEPTAFYDLPEPEERGGTALALNRYVQTLKRVATQAAPQDSWTGWLAVLAEALTAIGQMLAHLASLLGDTLRNLTPYLLAGGTVLALLAWGAYRLRGPLRDRWGAEAVARANPGQVAWVCYREMESWFERRGYGRAAGETLDEYAQRLCSLHPNQAEWVARITSVFTDQRYGDRQPGADESASLRQAYAWLTVDEERYQRQARR